MENIAHGNGVSEQTLGPLRDTKLFTMFTSGDHIWDNGEAKHMLEDSDWLLLRPENYPSGSPGHGHKVVQVGTKRLLVINVMGRSFMTKAELDSPFRAVSSVLDEYALPADENPEDKERVDAIFIDFHAETTSEKRAMAFLADGRASALVCTHTHVPTADAQVMPKGLGYLTDSGMVGPYPTVIGLEGEIALERFLTQMPTGRKDTAHTGRVEIGAALMETNKDGICKTIQGIREIVEE